MGNREGLRGGEGLKGGNGGRDKGWELGKG